MVICMIYIAFPKTSITMAAGKRAGVPPLWQYRSMTFLRALCTVLVTLLFLSGTGRAAIFSESGDAGDLTTTAQDTTGIGSLDLIRGNLIGSYDSTDTWIDDIDVFKINIPDLAAFSATTVGPGTEFVDTELFLFNADGIGVVANDDTGEFEFNAAIPVGTLSGISGLTPGLFFIAVAEFVDQPVSGGGLIFPDFSTLPNRDEVVTNTGPGGALALIEWDVDEFSEFQFVPLSQYEIGLTGAEFATAAVIPEPSTLASMSVLLTMAAFGFRRARRKPH
jgi:hypothetical protein